MKNRWYDLYNRSTGAYIGRVLCGGPWNANLLYVPVSGKA